MKPKPCCLLLLCVYGLAQTEPPLPAQTLTPQEAQVVRELTRASEQIHSWKATGVLSEKVSQRSRNEVYQRVSNLMKKYKPSETTSHHFSFDHPKLFFVALKGESSLYAEANLSVAQKDSVLPPSSAATLENIRKGGSCTVTNKGKTYEVLADVKNNYRMSLVQSSPLWGATEGFYVDRIGITPSEAILQRGFRFVREGTDPKFGRVFIFQGTHPEVAGNITFSLAPEFGYRVVSTTFTNPHGKIMRSHNVTSLVKVNGHWLPSEAVDTLFSDDPSITEPDLIKTYKFAHQTVNDVPDEVLEAKLAPGDYEWDEKTKATYKVGANGERIFQDLQSANTAKRMWPGWLFMVSVSTLLAVTVAGYVRWKRTH